MLPIQRDTYLLLCAYEKHEILARCLQRCAHEKRKNTSRNGKRKQFKKRKKREKQNLRGGTPSTSVVRRGGNEKR